MADDTAAGPDGPTTKRLDFKKQSLDDAYAAPANLLEIEVCNSETHGFGRNRYTDYEVKMRVGANDSSGCVCDLFVCITLHRAYMCGI